MTSVTDTCSHSSSTTQASAPAGWAGASDEHLGDAQGVDEPLRGGCVAEGARHCSRMNRSAAAPEHEVRNGLRERRSTTYT
jgi:hypothetical protein